MQITDMLSQYNRNIASGVEIAGGTQGIKQITSSLSEMSVGNVFEGSINHMENGTVTLGLPDGKTILAKLDSGVAVKVGESMFFQVRSNNGAQIAIRPFSGSFGNNPTLLNALEAANLPVNGKTITMVNTMMEQSMSIDKQSLMNMARLLMGNENMDVNTIVQMVKLGIPVTEEFAAQFENYKSDQYAILNELESVMETLPEKLSDGSMDAKQLLDFNREMIKIFLDSEQVSEDGKVLVNGEKQTSDTNAVMQTQTAEKSEAETALPKLLEEGVRTVPMKEAADVLLQEDIFASNSRETGEAEHILPEKTMTEQAMADRAEEAEIRSQPDLVKNLLSESGLQRLARQLLDIPELAKNPVLFQEGNFNADITSKELLKLLDQAFASQNSQGKKAISDLISSKGYRTLIRSVMEQQWLMKPEELKSQNKVNELYERLDRQLGQMEKVLKGFGQNASAFSDTAANVRSNIQFMNQINQIYSYVQIPLKLAGQNAHSDLYVYSDKRKKGEKDGELTAFLHLDLDHLGSTDVSIRLHQKQVATNFYLADDASYQLILNNMELLQKRLEEKGYHVSIQVANQKKEADFVGNLLNQGSSSVGGMVHRYSFDVRA